MLTPNVENKAAKLRWKDLKYVAELPAWYKYTNIKNATLFFEHRALHYSSPLNFNDPFDCHPLLIKVSDRYIQQTIEEETKLNFKSDKAFLLTPAYNKLMHDIGSEIQRGLSERFLPVTKITCFSKNKHNLLMWSHYGHNHSGVCLEFSPSNYLNFLNLLIPSSKVDISTFLKVDYCKKRINYAFDHAEDMYPIYQWLKSKSNDWSYEGEIRHLMLNTSDNLLPIPTEVLSKVYLGSRISDEDRDKITILCRKNFPETEIYQMKLSAIDFSLREEKI